MDRTEPLTIYLTPEEKAQLSNWADDAGKSQSELGRDAIREYLDHDRASRQDEKLDQILDAVQSLSGENNTHTQRSNSVPETARNVAEHLYQQHDEVMKADDVEFGIENIADVGDKRSVNKYKRQFKKRGLLYEHPGDPPLWTSSTDQFGKWLASYAELNGDDAARDIADDYPSVYVDPGPNNTIQIEVKNE